MKVNISLLAQPGFGKFCAMLRSRHGLTLREVEQVAGVPRSTWARAEGGDDIRLSVVAKILAWADQQGALADGISDRYVD